MAESSGVPMTSLNKQIVSTLNEIEMLNERIQKGEKSPELLQHIQHCLSSLHESTNSLKVLTQYHEDFSVKVNPSVPKRLRDQSTVLLQNKFVQERMGQEVIKAALTALSEFQELIGGLDVDAKEENLIRVTKVDQDPLSR